MAELRTRQQRTAFMAALSPTTRRKAVDLPDRPASPSPFVLNSTAPQPMNPNISQTKSWTIDYGLYSTQGRREAMEDSHCVGENGDYFMWGLFDGHDGQSISALLEQNFWRYFVESPLLSVRDKLVNASERLDRQVLSQNLEGGSTAVICVLEKSIMRLHIYNVGDSECILVTPGWAWQLLSVIHRTQNPTEVERIKQIGASHHVTIEKNRVNGIMEARLCGYGVSRAFGDHKYAKMPTLPCDVLTCIGDYTYRDLEGPEGWQDLFLVLHCDGLTECLSHDQVVNIMKENRVDASGMNASQIAELLGQAGFASGSTDNISVIAVRFSHQITSPVMPQQAPQMIAQPVTPGRPGLPLVPIPARPATPTGYQPPPASSSDNAASGTATPPAGFTAASTPARGRRRLSQNREQQPIPLNFSITASAASQSAGPQAQLQAPVPVRTDTPMDIDTSPS